MLTDLDAPAPLTIRLAHETDAPHIARLHAAVAAHLTHAFGNGHWSNSPNEVAVLRGIKTSRVIIALDRDGLAGTLRLATKKPWAIDLKFFTPVVRSLYLLDMAVRPSLQRSGLGRRLLDEASSIARVWPADALRLDAYDAPAGAGGFYARCGYREVGRAVFRGTPLIYFERVVRAG